MYVNMYKKTIPLFSNASELFPVITVFGDMQSFQVLRRQLYTMFQLLLKNGQENQNI
jgi:hypothetical protein